MQWEGGPEWFGSADAVMRRTVEMDWHLPRGKTFTWTTALFLLFTLIMLSHSLSPLPKGKTFTCLPALSPPFSYMSLTLSPICQVFVLIHPSLSFLLLFHPYLSVHHPLLLRGPSCSSAKCSHPSILPSLPLSPRSFCGQGTCSSAIKMKSTVHCLCVCVHAPEGHKGASASKTLHMYSI